MDDRNPLSTWPFIALLLLVTAAVVIQDFTGAVPSGLFNTGRGVAFAVSIAALVACVAAVTILLVEVARRRRSRAGAMVRVAVVSAVILELMVSAADITAMSRSPQAPLGGPYYETRTESGDWMILRKHGDGSPFGFRTDHPYAFETDAYRVLFLGDSYTEGSGRQPECNYPTVVQHELAARLARPVEIMNAGVSGYGPGQALVLLRELLARGYRADAVVYNFLIENDFTDDLPATRRRVVAGMAFRFPHSWFLRAFHPVNTRTFRTAMFLRALVRIRYELGDMAAIPDEPCDLAPPQPSTLSQAVGDIVSRKLADARRVAADERLQSGATASIRAIREVAAAAGMPFVLVLFPQRATVDPSVGRLVDVTGRDVAIGHRLRDIAAAAVPDAAVIDADDALQGREGMYRSVDTHLSDLGNVVAGTRVAEQLSAILEAE
jgi:hypothetical protein